MIYKGATPHGIVQQDSLHTGCSFLLYIYVRGDYLFKTLTLQLTITIIIS